MKWTQEQYDQLTARYRDMPDADLRRLAATPEDLTEMAEEVIGKEIAARKLSLQPEPIEHEEQDAYEEESTPERDGDLWFSYALKAPAHCTFEFDTARQARNAAAFLWESRIDSQVLEPQPDTISIQGPRLVVLPRDAERATAILAQPIPDHITSEPDVVVEDFVTPACPECGAPDPVLIAIDSTNQWLCEACEHEWEDSAEPDSEPAK